MIQQKGLCLAYIQGEEAQMQKQSVEENRVTQEEENVKKSLFLVDILK